MMVWEWPQTYTPKKPPQLTWGVKDVHVREAEQHEWVVCTVCDTVSFYDVPPGKDWRWIGENVKCPRCKAFASKLTHCPPEVFEAAVADREANPPPSPSRPGTAAKPSRLLPARADKHTPITAPQPAPVAHQVPAGRVVDPAKPFEGRFYFYCYAHRDEKGLIRIQGNAVCCNQHPCQVAADDPRVVITSLQEITEAEHDVLALAIPQR